MAASGQAGLGLSAYRSVLVGSTGVVIKGSPGQVFGIQLSTTGKSSSQFISLYDTASVPTTALTSTLAMTFSVTVSDNVTWTVPGINFSNGIGIRGGKLNNGTSNANPLSTVTATVLYA